MRRVLPKYFTATQLARSGERLEGSVALADLPRLAAVAGIAGRESGTASSMPVRLALQADFDDEGVVRFRGTFSVNLLLQCQRCLDELLVALHAELRVAVVSSEAQEALLPVGEEGLLVPDGKVDLHQMLEEEVLLALPAAPVLLCLTSTPIEQLFEQYVLFIHSVSPPLWMEPRFGPSHWVCLQSAL